VDGQAAVRPVIWASISVNHRVWDGLSAARFLNEFVKILESVDPAL
jgi:pyruvate/2-oxoglutarate dehydrogenase complex dihydrolipoamide acyltransferase (E2) component